MENIGSQPDHLVDAERIRMGIFKAMTPSQRWEQAVKLRRMAWEIKRAGERISHPEWTDDEIENSVREIFTRATT